MAVSGGPPGDPPSGPWGPGGIPNPEGMKGWNWLSALPQDEAYFWTKFLQSQQGGSLGRAIDTLNAYMSQGVSKGLLQDLLANPPGPNPNPRYTQLAFNFNQATGTQGSQSGEGYQRLLNALYPQGRSGSLPPPTYGQQLEDYLINNDWTQPGLESYPGETAIGIAQGLHLGVPFPEFETPPAMPKPMFDQLVNHIKSEASTKRTSLEELFGQTSSAGGEYRGIPLMGGNDPTGAGFTVNNIGPYRMSVNDLYRSIQPDSPVNQVTGPLRDIEGNVFPPIGPTGPRPTPAAPGLPARTGATQAEVSEWLAKYGRDPYAGQIGQRMAATNYLNHGEWPSGWSQVAPEGYWNTPPSSSGLARTNLPPQYNPNVIEGMAWEKGATPGVGGPGNPATALGNTEGWLNSMPWAQPAQANGGFGGSWVNARADRPWLPGQEMFEAGGGLSNPMARMGLPLAGAIAAQYGPGLINSYAPVPQGGKDVLGNTLAGAGIGAQGFAFGPEVGVPTTILGGIAGFGKSIGESLRDIFS